MNRRFKTVVFCTLLAGLPFAVPAAPVTISSPKSLAPLVEKWIQGYKTNNAAAKIRYKIGGTESGIASLQNRQADITLVAKKIKPAEESDFIAAFGKRPHEYKVAIDPLLIFVNDANPIVELDLDTLTEIFSGRIRSWKEIGGADVSITLYTREYSSTAFEFFKGSILKDSAPILSAQVIPGQSAMLNAVARDKAGLGYGGPTQIAGVKALSIKKNARAPAIEPTRDTFRDGAYPLTGYIYAYVHPARDRGAVTECLDWIRSEEGQDIARENGYYRVPPGFREKWPLPSQ